MKKNEVSTLLYLNKLPFVSLDSVPDEKGENCTISINISWEMAEKIAIMAAPFLSAISESVDCRSDKQRKRDNYIAELKERHRQNNIIIKRCYYNCLKWIHYNNLNYHQFCDTLDTEIKKHPLYHSVNGKQRQLMYRRIKIWSIQRLRNEGLTNAQIAKIYNTSKTNISGYYNKNRRAIKLSV
ncbi:MAG: hypothetical protein PQ612_06170 [Rickettsiales bacterium]|nr:hypothetical protein [Pseudomonadota bacterium]MDA0966557.1 hypothetical protein [Pseudomonadota bacterium]MDG4543586.1 hypothetical protein [Rickettsiales bacterium]MDG4545733.1 hypothetical protein [Rickettsiales bacterium]MDG4547494.1 hypothetical protein [Rickettsiales bacterium]